MPNEFSAAKYPTLKSLEKSFTVPTERMVAILYQDGNPQAAERLQAFEARIKRLEATILARLK